MKIVSYSPKYVESNGYFYFLERGYFVLLNHQIQHFNWSSAVVILSLVPGCSMKRHHCSTAAVMCQHADSACLDLHSIDSQFSCVLLCLQGFI